MSTDGVEKYKPINWVVKASKLCNLRCSYCYEWHELAKRDRISLANWERLLRAIRDYHDMRIERTGAAQRSNIIWHGGEPTLLPIRYLKDVLALQKEILGPERLGRGEFSNALQSNLYHLSDELLDFFAAGPFQLGVSFDVVPGLRLTAGGKDSEQRVADNLDRLRHRDVGAGAIVVLAAHTAPRVTEIYDYFEELRMPVRFLPLFQSPRSEEDGIAISNVSLQRALRRLFVHWIDRPEAVRVAPLLDHVYTVLLKLKGDRQAPYDRRLSGEWALIVNTDGELYQRLDAYVPGASLGNVFQESIQSIVQSDRYERSLARDDGLSARYCKGCKYEGPCNGLDVFESPRADDGARRCNLAYPLNQFIENYFRKNGFTVKDIGALIGAFNKPHKPEKTQSQRPPRQRAPANIAGTATIAG